MEEYTQATIQLELRHGGSVHPSPTSESKNPRALHSR
jgi:hypothetical protein